MNFGFALPMLYGFYTRFVLISNIGKVWEDITRRRRIAPGIGFGLNAFTNSVDSKIIFLLVIGKSYTLLDVFRFNKLQHLSTHVYC